MISQLYDLVFEATELDDFLADFLVEFDLFGNVVVEYDDGSEELLEQSERRRGLDVVNLVIPRDTFVWTFGLANLDSEVVVIATKDDTAFDFARVLDDQATGFVDCGLVVEVAAEDVVESLGEFLVVEEGFFLLDEGSEIHFGTPFGWYRGKDQSGETRTGLNSSSWLISSSSGLCGTGKQRRP